MNIFPLISERFIWSDKAGEVKSLILYGLDHYPERIDLLYDLTYFHEFENILSTLIDYCMRGCNNEMNLETFTDLASELYFASLQDGYDALYALQEFIGSNPEKRKIIDALIREYTGTEDFSDFSEFY